MTRPNAWPHYFHLAVKKQALGTVFRSREFDATIGRSGPCACLPEARYTSNSDRSAFSVGEQRGVWPVSVKFTAAVTQGHEQE